MIHFIEYRDTFNGNSWSGPYCKKCKEVFWPANKNTTKYIVCPTCKTIYYFPKKINLPLIISNIFKRLFYFIHNRIEYWTFTRRRKPYGKSASYWVFDTLEDDFVRIDK